MAAAKRPRGVTVLCDFDGTIAYNDLGDELFRRHGTFEPYHTELLRGDYTVAEYWRRVCATLPVGMSEAEVEAFARAEDFDPAVAALAELCGEQGWRFAVVSDGFGSYIRTVLRRAGIPDAEVYCNELLYSAEKPPAPSFPRRDEACSCFVASCKRNALLAVAHPDDVIVMIGDGASDRCAAEHADIIFAKKALAAYCNEHRLPHHPWRWLSEVVYRLRLLQRSGDLRPRHQAALRRAEAWTTE